MSMVDPEGERAAAAPCRRCNRAFGFAVAHCPFCGEQQPAASPPVATPPAVPQAATAAAAGSARVAGQGTSTSPSVSKVPDPVKSPEPAPTTGEGPPFPWFRVLGALGGALGGVLGIWLVAAWLLRPHPGAHLTVQAASGAEGRVLIDGNDAGRTGEMLDVATGMHEIGLDIEGHMATLHIVLAPGESREVTFPTARPAANAEATLVLQRNTPDMTIGIDGRTIAPGDEATVKPGLHRLTATSPDHMDLALNLFLKPGERRVVPLTLSPAPQQSLPAPQPTDPTPQAAPAPPLGVISAGIWSTFGDPSGPDKSCGVQAGISGGTLMLVGQADAPATLRLALHKQAWHIPGLTVPMDIAFSGGPDPESAIFHFRASGSGSDIRADIPDGDVKAFIHHFSADQTATLILPKGRELPWTIDLHGTTPTISGMAKCLEAAQLWLPPPFTQRPAADAPAPAPGQN